MPLPLSISLSLPPSPPARRDSVGVWRLKFPAGLRLRCICCYGYIASCLTEWMLAWLGQLIIGIHTSTVAGDTAPIYTIDVILVHVMRKLSVTQQSVILKNDEK